MPVRVNPSKTTDRSSQKVLLLAAMRIAVNTRLLLPGKLEGIGWFTSETLKRITTERNDLEFIFLFDRPFADEFIFSGNIEPVVAGPPSRHPVLWYLWFEYTVPRLLAKTKADLFLSPDGYLSLSTDVPSVPVMHDINFEHFPKDLPYTYRKYYQHYFPKYARKATRIATVSEFSKQDIVSHYQVEAAKIDVVYNGANEAFRPIGAEEQQKTRTAHTGGHPYFLFIGSLHPRKNLANLFKAYDLFASKGQHHARLLIVGEKKWWTTNIREAYENMKHKDRVIFAGRQTPAELAKIIASTLAMVYVSYFEGFGIPIVEGMYAGVPVITSNVTSMPEVAGDAALLVDPFSVESIADGLQKLANDPEFATDLVKKGNIRKQEFSWQQSADRLMKCMERTLEMTHK